MAYFKKLQALIFLLFFSHFVAYSDTPVVFQKSLLELKKVNLCDFLKKNIQLTFFEYGGNLGAIDFLMAGKSHHYWAQVGILSFDLLHLLGSGVGYRYLFGKDRTNQEWFLGVYGYHRWREQLNWGVGIEVATKYLQGTLNRYSTQPASHNKIAHDLEKDIGYSLRISTYYFEKIHWFGRINPFFVIAHTKRYRAQKAQAFKPQTFWNGGLGVRWELGCITFEIKAIGDTVKPSQFSKARYRIGCHINFSEKEIARNDTRCRLRKASEHYEPTHYNNSKSDSKPLKAVKKPEEIMVKPVQGMPPSQLQEPSDQLSFFVKILTAPKKKARQSADAMIIALQNRLNRHINKEYEILGGSADVYNDDFIDQLINTMIDKEKEFENSLRVEQGAMGYVVIENTSQNMYLETLYTIMARLVKKRMLSGFLEQARIMRNNNMVYALRDRLNRCIIEHGTFGRSKDKKNIFLDKVINMMVEKEPAFRNDLKVKPEMMASISIGNIENGSGNIALEEIYAIMARLDQQGALGKFLTQARIIRTERDRLDKYWLASDYADDICLTFA